MLWKSIKLKRDPENNSDLSISDKIVMQSSETTQQWRPSLEIRDFHDFYFTLSTLSWPSSAVTKYFAILSDRIVKLILIMRLPGFFTPQWRGEVENKIGQNPDMKRFVKIQCPSSRGGSELQIQDFAEKFSSPYQLWSALARRLRNIFQFCLIGL